MPPVRGPVIKARAAQLRAAGDGALQRHLAAQIGQNHSILMESPRMGRTAQFTEVDFAAEQPEGQIVSARITGASNQRLIA
jgi:threonylcarbamoyladenosine tRNA methylthiotransferase MtaB